MGIVFKAEIEKLGALNIVRLPQSASDGLPSRGMVMVEGTMNGQAFSAPAEPDGKGGHWFEVGDSLWKKIKGDTARPFSFELHAQGEWAEPVMPEDIMGAIAAAGLMGFWQGLTVKARWEWLRWIRATNNKAIRAKHIEVAVSKMRQGGRRPCCFNSAACTVPQVSRGGILMD
jgi:hypothetical protein